jgi:hypothetical protein
MRWWLAGIASIVLIRAAAPYALGVALESVAADAGLGLEIGDIDLELLAGAIALERVRVQVSARSEAAGNRPLLEIARLRADLIWRDLLSSRVHLSAVQIDEARVLLIQREDGSFALPVDEPAADAPQQEINLAESPGAPQGQGLEHDIPDGEPLADRTSDGDPAKSWEFGIDEFELNEADFALQRVDRDDESVRFKLLRFGLSAFSLGADGAGVGRIDFDHPELHVEREWLLGDGENTEASDADDSAQPLPPFRLEHFAMTDGRFQIQTREGPLDVGVRVEVSNLSTAADHAFPVELALRSDEGSIAIDGQLTLFPLAYEGRLSWSGLDAPPYLLITNPGLVPWIQSANASGDFEVSFRATDTDAGPAGITLRGRTGFTNLIMKDPDSDELSLHAKRFEVELREAVYPLEPSVAQPRRVEVTRLLVESPRVVFTNPPDALDRFLILYTGVESEPGADLASETDTGSTEPPSGQASDSTAGEPTEVTPEPQSLFISVDAFDLSDGRLAVIDKTVSPIHETQFRDLSVEASDVALSPVLGAKAFAVAGLVQEQGAFTLNGSLPNGQGKLQFDLRSLDLVSYDPFARRAGWHVDSGSASLDSAIRIGDGEYEADNELRLHDLRVDEDGASNFLSLFGHSLDFTLALLRGPNGDIALSVPVAWNAEGLGLGLRSALLSATKGALVGALASPLKLAGGVLASGDRPASFQPLSFEAGSSTIETATLDRVESLAALLTSRPRLALEIRGQLAPADGPALAARLLQEDAVEGRSFPEVEAAGLLSQRRVKNALRERAAGDDGPLDAEDAELFERFIAARTVPRESLEALAQARQTSVRDALNAAGVPVRRLRLAGPVDTEEPGVSVELHLGAQVGVDDSEGSQQ